MSVHLSGCTALGIHHTRALYQHCEALLWRGSRSIETNDIQRHQKTETNPKCFMIKEGAGGQGFTEERACKLALWNGRIWIGLDGEREHAKEAE